MLGISFKVTQGRLAKTDMREFERAIIAFQDQFVDEARRKLEYTATSNPELPPGSKYKRRRYKGQGLLGGWVVQHSRFTGNGDLVASLENTRNFAKKVYGDRYGRGQVAIHSNRWPLVAQIRNQREYENGIRRIFRSFGGS